MSPERLAKRILDITADHGMYRQDPDRVISLNRLEVLAFAPGNEIREALLSPPLAGILVPAGVGCVAGRRLARPPRIPGRACAVVTRKTTHGPRPTMGGGRVVA